MDNQSLRDATNYILGNYESSYGVDVSFDSIFIDDV